MDVISTFVSRMGDLIRSISHGLEERLHRVIRYCSANVLPDILAVFCATGNEYPDIMKFVRNDTERDMGEVWIPVGEQREKSDNPRGKNKSQQPYTSVKRLNKRAFRVSEEMALLLAEDFNTCHKCCTILKKNPFKHFEAINGCSPILGVMASESELREKGLYQTWRL